MSSYMARLADSRWLAGYDFTSRVHTAVIADRLSLVRSSHKEFRKLGFAPCSDRSASDLYSAWLFRAPCDKWATPVAAPLYVDRTVGLSWPRIIEALWLSLHMCGAVKVVSPDDFDAALVLVPKPVKWQRSGRRV